jgi:hypothetical protein
VSSTPPGRSPDPSDPSGQAKHCGGGTAAIGRQRLVRAGGGWGWKRLEKAMKTMGNMGKYGEIQQDFGIW